MIASCISNKRWKRETASRRFFFYFFIFFEKIPFVRYSVGMSDTLSKPNHKPEQRHQYLHWDEKTITDFSSDAVASLYDRGYVFTRKGKGVMHQTRSVRIDLSKFELSSENRRILKKIFDIEITHENIPYRDYSWPVAKLAKDFYSVKFGNTIMGAAKVKEILTDATKSNFNSLLVYDQKRTKKVFAGQPMTERLGYAICYENTSPLDASLLHYCYPFYELDKSPKDMGLGMIIRAIEYAKTTHKRYVYLGSLQRPSDVYKLQFSGIEWFDGDVGKNGTWQTDIEAAKEILKKYE
jgi:arginyl-tRNA--protein-N-Asp/Glu arginylyltransferase